MAPNLVFVFAVTKLSASPTHAFAPLQTAANSRNTQF